MTKNNDDNNSNNNDKSRSKEKQPQRSNGEVFDFHFFSFFKFPENFF